MTYSRLYLDREYFNLNEKSDSFLFSSFIGHTVKEYSNTLKTETGLLKTDLKSNYTFENALDFEELEVFSDNAIDVILKLS